MHSKDFLAFLLFTLVFFGLMFYKFDLENQRSESARRAFENQKLIEEKIKLDAIKEKNKYTGIIKHDSNPETKIYPIKLDASASFDQDNDGLEFEWAQISGPRVSLSSYDSPVSYFNAIEGEYVFELRVKDAYGDYGTFEKTIHIAPEENTPPTAKFKVLNQKQPRRPKWYMNADSVKIFQAYNNLKIDGVWGPACSKKWSDPTVRDQWKKQTGN